MNPLILAVPLLWAQAAPAPAAVTEPAPATQPVPAPSPAPAPQTAPAQMVPPDVVRPEPVREAPPSPPPPPSPPATTSVAVASPEVDKADDEDERDVTPPRFNLSLSLDQLWHGQRSYDLFSTNDVQSSIGGSVGYAVWMQGPWSAVPEIGLGFDAQEGNSAYGSAIREATLESTRAYVGARVRYLLLPFLEPHVRIAGGFERLRAEIQTNSSETFSKTERPAFVSVGAGLSIHTRPGALRSKRGGLGNLLFGGVLEGGYTLSGSMDLALTADGASPRVPTSTTSFGTLERSGPYVRLAADVRF